MNRTTTSRRTLVVSLLAAASLLVASADEEKQGIHLRHGQEPQPSLRSPFQEDDTSSLALSPKFGSGGASRRRRRRMKLKEEDEEPDMSEDAIPGGCERVMPLSEKEFDLDRYVEKTWFIQKQQVNPYQSENDLFCVTATYNRRDDGFVQVQNVSSQGSVANSRDSADNEDDGGGALGGLCAEQLNGGSLQVAPCILQKIGLFSTIAGPYWVLALDEEEYSWAVISGGQPDQIREVVDGRTLCTTRQEGSFLNINGTGLWLFTRERIASPETIATMENKLEEMGIYTGDLIPVAHKGCTYPTFIKE